MKDKRVRINKRMVAWSDGERTNVVPSVWHKVDDYGSALYTYISERREGDELYMPGTVRSEKNRCLEYEADRCWERGRHLWALNQMLDLATMSLPDEADDIRYEDVQWLDPDEVSCCNPFVREYMRLMRRCEDYCKRDPRLWPVLEAEAAYSAYRRYLVALGRWAHGE